MVMSVMMKKLVTSAIVYYIFLQLAMRFGIFGPTIIDLKNNLNVSQEKMSIVFCVTSAGVCVGALCGGIIFNYIQRQIGLSIIVLINGIQVSLLAFITEYQVFLGWQFVIGVTSGAAISACEAWILEIWSEDCPPYMQALQFFRGLGYILGPIIAEPFLALESDIKNSNDSIASTNNSNSNKSSILVLNNYSEYDYSVDETITESNIWIPYLINGCLLIIGSVVILSEYLVTKVCKSRCTDLPSVSSQANMISVWTLEMQMQEPKEFDATETNETLNTCLPKPYALWLICLCSFFYLFFFEEVIVTYLASFAINIDLHLSTSNAAFLTSAFNLANVVGKAISILVALKLNHFVMLYIHLSIILVSLFLLFIYANISLVMLWFGVCLLGIGLSSIIASLYALMENSIQMNSLVCGIINMSGTLGSVFTPLVLARYIELQPIVLISISIICTVACFLLLFTIHYSIVTRSKKIAFKN